MIRMKVHQDPAVKLRLQDETVRIKAGIKYESVKPYAGEYEFTPTEQTQTIAINNRKAMANIVINPIPSNYGKITWTGNVLTVE